MLNMISIKYHLRNRSFGTKLWGFFFGTAFIGAAATGVMIGQNMDWYWIVGFGGLVITTLSWFGTIIGRVRKYRCDMTFDLDPEKISMTRFPLICIGACDLPETHLQRSDINHFYTDKRVKRGGSGPTRVYYDLVVSTRTGTMTLLSQAAEEDDLDGLAKSLNDKLRNVF